MFENSISVVITAGGSSSRMGLDKNKLLIELDNKTVIERTIEKFLNISNVVEIIVVSGDGIYEEVKEIASRIQFNIKIVQGGNSREESTYNGIIATNEKSSHILCHDGARPLVSRDVILKCIKEIENYDAVITGVPTKDTIKIVSSDLEVVSTPNRENLFNIQTPQIFKRDILLKAYENLKREQFKVTDDSSIVAKLDIPIKLVESDYSNIKITTKEDIYLATELLNKEK